MKKHIFSTEKLIISEIVFSRLATRYVNIVIEMPVAKNSIRYRAVTDRNQITEEHLKSGTFEINSEQRDII
jgi:hypothetical protein